MKIGFYGDSFCCEISNPHSILKNYDTYIKKIKNFYQADIVHLGHGGSSVWDVIIQQFDINNIPDICIFCWTDANRLYNKNVRHLTMGSVCGKKKLKDISFGDLWHIRTVNAAREYFTHLYDFEKSNLENLAAMQYFDNNVLNHVNSKIIHLYSFENVYNWRHGIVIDPPLNTFVDKNVYAANHLNGDIINQKVFEIINTAISN